MGEGGQGGYEQRIEVTVKVAKKKLRGGDRSNGGVGVGVGVGVDANDELKLL